MKPKVPKVEKPKTPIQADSTSGSAGQQRAIAPRGLDAFIKAGRLTSKATTRKSSLLGGG